MEKMIETRRLDALTPHPQNQALYGNDMHEPDEKLVDSLRKGVWEGEIQVTTGNVIISGHRRWANAALADIEEARVWVRTDLPEDPMAPEVLAAFLDANIQRVKTNEQRVREWSLRMEVERVQARQRMNWRKAASGQDEDSCLGPNVPPMDRRAASHRARDLAAKVCGLEFTGRHIYDAAKALKAADEAIQSDDPEIARKGLMVKHALNSKVTRAIRVARTLGLLPHPQPRSGVERPQPQAQEPEVMVEANVEEPAEPAEPVKLPKGLLDFRRKQMGYLKDRLFPAMQMTAEAYALFRQEHERLRNSYTNPSLGRTIFTNKYQQCVSAWAEDGSLTEMAELMRSDGETFDALLLRLEDLGKYIGQMAHSMRMFTGCRKDNNVHD